jgi:flagellar basal-body rod modification protein FlgD
MAVTSTTATSSAEDLQSRYLKLLVAQMKNQDPMSPMSNDQMTAQMTSLSQLEQLQNISGQLSQIDTINSNFNKVLQNSQMSYAQSMVGKGVTYKDDLGNIQMGVVDQVELKDGNLALRVGEKSVAIDKIIAIGTQYGVAIPNDQGYATSLLNKTVEYYDSDTKTIKSGKVTSVDTADGAITVQVNKTVVPLSQVTGIVQ